LCEIDRGDGIGDGRCCNGLVTVAVVAALGVGGVGLVADAAGGAVIVVDTRQVVLGIEIVPARVVHELAVAVDAEVAELERVGIAAVVAVVAAVVDDVGDADDIAVVARQLAFNVTVGDVVFGVVGILRLF